ncbi:hypothetical protein [Xanthomonas campestris]|uniref:hypothetical protein n=1 Tax=Xanthomonas campestris TaxID=339 RepID=UPI001D14F9A7|nr:hypothetical protein [Xanthomonas campestris]MCC3253691.1 hypothetical protein [Xanthomonas campestris pv. armoraciae]
MAIISENKTFGTQTKVVSPRIEIRWDPATNEGPVEFHLEQMTTKPHQDGWTQTLERFFLRVLTVPISDLIGRSYPIVNPDSGEQSDEPGVRLLLGIKAATRAAYDANVARPDPEADPIARHIAIIWNPINDTGNVTFQVEDRGVALGVLAESIAELTAKVYVIPDLTNGGHLNWPGWKLEAMIKAATDIAFVASTPVTAAGTVAP